MNLYDRLIKRLFDITFSFFGLIVLWPFLLLFAILNWIHLKGNPFYVQRRIGKECKNISVIKFKTMKNVSGYNSTITVDEDPRITTLGRFLRKTKIDEMPQLVNVLLGSMSFVGPRPDVSGYADCLKGKNAIITTIRPGITGPASIKYKNEELILSNVSDPKVYNDTVIWPDKVNINVTYIENYSFYKDMKYILDTIL